MSDDYTMTGTLIRQVLDDLKYLNRLNKYEFIDLLFPGEWWDATPETGYEVIIDGKELYVSPYGESKWDIFQHDKLAFFSGCDRSKFEKMAEYINDVKSGVIE